MNFLVSVLIFISVISCSSKIISLETHSNDYVWGEKSLFEDDIKEIRDSNNTLNKYIGIWKYTSNNGTNYELKINKGTTSGSFITHKDVLFVRYKIIDATGKTIENTLNILDDESSLIIKGSSFLHTTYTLLYGGRESNCGQFGTIFMTVLPENPTNMIFKFIPEVNLTQSRCPSFKAAKQVLPVEKVHFTKQ